MTTLKNKIVTIRKDRKCFSCLRVFTVGSKMNYWSGIFDGDFSYNYSCLTCVQIINMSQDENDEGIPEGFVREMLNSGETPEQKLEEFNKEIMK